MFFEILEGLKIAFNALRANKMRSALTTLGVVIGITFVIMMGWFLDGLDNVWNQTVSIIGSDVFYIDKYDWAGGKSWDVVRNRKNIMPKQAEEFIDKFSEYALCVPSARRWGATVKLGSSQLSSISVIGTLAGYAEISAGGLETGRFFTAAEDQTAAPVIVLGYNVANALFPNGDAIGQTIKLSNRPLTVVGVMKKQGTVIMPFVDNQVYISLRPFLSMFSSRRNIAVAVKAGGVDKLDEVRSHAIGVMRQVRNVQPGADDDFSINETKVFQEQIAKIRIVIYATGLGMTALSFLVGIIGIMNIMFVSVTERTKEIGIRKALGAKSRSILFQFLVEAATLCFGGAFIAFVLTSGIIWGVTSFVEAASFLTPYIPLKLLGIASLVSLCVGVLAGLLPARRAAKMDVVDALRFE